MSVDLILIVAALIMGIAALVHDIRWAAGGVIALAVAALI